MRKCKLFCWMIAVILPLSSFAQGVDFKELTMQEALALAGKEKKMIFIDFYTTWCGPCKMMSSEVFTQEQVGTYFNRVFVNMKVDAEKGEGVELAKKYQVRAYPTFVVLRADGTEVYRTSGARPAEEFIDKIRKGIDPKWSPEGLARRYKKGERTPELVNEYALLQMETGNIELGNQVIREYFNKLSDKKRVKPENLFLYTRYALNYRDPKADYMFAHKDRFVKENGREEVESLLYNWLRQQIMPFVAARVVSDMEVNEGEWIRLKEKIHDADLSNGKILAELEEIAEVRLKNSMKDYLDICREKFPQLEDRDCFSILVGFGVLKEQNEEIRQAAADLLRDNLNVAEGFNKRVLYSIMLDLEGKKEFRLRAAIDAAEKGKVVVTYSSKGKFMQEEHEFDNYMLDISMAGKDTVSAGIRFLCDELAMPTAEGTKLNPHFSFMIVPGEFAVLKLDLEKGKVPVVKWEKGGPVSRDFVRLNYDLLTPEEKAYNQLMIDNIIQGGDIRNYPEEFQRSFDANKRKTMEFIRNNPDSYIAVMKLAEHYIWFDENETEDIYSRFPANLKGNSYGRIIAQRLKRSQDFRIGMPAKNFEKKDMNGKTVSLEELRGKYVLLDFWGSWCAPCRASHPHLKELYEKYKKQVVFINVAQENVKDQNEARKLWKTAVKEDGLTWTQILNNEGRETCDMIRLFNIYSFPTKVLIDPNGIVVARMVGGLVDAGEVLEKLVD
ncbi:MAG: thioredoxin fold domain-containing protein [Sanguibacteroides justesenii]|nr:thioredoxin fold domain-containing protein [Sanguibacteroides justesenii]